MASDRSRSARRRHPDAALAALCRLLIVNQYRAPKIDRRLRDYRVERPLEFQSTLFERLLSTGEFHPGLDPEATTVKTG